jgi:hypothetical protein
MEQPPYLLLEIQMYTYAFLSHSDIPLSLPEGISGSLQLVTVDGLAALVEPDLMPDALQTSDDVLVQAVLCHDQVIREVFEQATVLPLRFGTCFVSRQGLVEHLGSHSAEYLRKLTKLKGQAEYLLKLAPLDMPNASLQAELRGKHYFLAKKQQYQTQIEWQQYQQAQLAKLLDTIALRFPNWTQTEASDGIERIYILSSRQDEILLYDWVKTWQSMCPQWELSLGQALPPYHFV